MDLITPEHVKDMDPCLSVWFLCFRNLPAKDSKALFRRPNLTFTNREIMMCFMMHADQLAGCTATTYRNEITDVIFLLGFFCRQQQIMNETWPMRTIYERLASPEMQGCVSLYKPNSTIPCN